MKLASSECDHLYSQSPRIIVSTEACRPCGGVECVYLILTGIISPESSVCHGRPGLTTLSPSDLLKSYVESSMSETDTCKEMSGEQPERKFVLNVWWLVFFLVFVSTIGK